MDKIQLFFTTSVQNGLQSLFIPKEPKLDGLFAPNSVRRCHPPKMIGPEDFYRDDLHLERPQASPDAVYEITAKGIAFWKGRFLKRGDKFPCSICGETGNWQEVSHSPVYICYHGRVLYFEALREQDTVPKYLVE